MLHAVRWLRCADSADNVAVSLSVLVSFCFCFIYFFFSFYFCLLCSALAVVCSSAYAANIRGIKIVCAAAATFHALLRIFASPFALAFFRDY